MKEYHVMWDIEVDARNHIEAAETALKIQRDPDSTATAFRVIDMAGKVVFVDLKRDAVPDLRSNSEELTREDWVEIYYAMHDKYEAGRAVSSDRKWKTRLRSILKRLGPDAENMYQTGGGITPTCLHCLERKKQDLEEKCGQEKADD